LPVSLEVEVRSEANNTLDLRYTSGGHAIVFTLESAYLETSNRPLHNAVEESDDGKGKEGSANVQIINGLHSGQTVAGSRSKKVV
jgi:hypothetical protein